MSIEMKKLAVVLFTALGIMFGSALSASAADGYPPGATVVFTVPTQPVPAGGSVPVTLSNITPGASVTFKLNGVSHTVTANPSGVASFIFTAPANPNTYTVSATLGTTTYNRDFVVTAAATTTTTTIATTTTTVKPTATVPVTGSNTPAAGVALGVPLLVGGLALLLVSRRRRDTVVA